MWSLAMWISCVLHHVCRVYFRFTKTFFVNCGVIIIHYYIIIYYYYVCVLIGVSIVFVMFFCVS